MKKIYDILGVLALSATVLTSCVGDLNVTPIDPNANTADKALVNEAAYEQFLAGVYLGFATSSPAWTAAPPSTSAACTITASSPPTRASAAGTTRPSRTSTG